MEDTDWNEKFSGQEYYFGTKPNAFLESHAHLMEKGKFALAVADGEGRNGVWMAERGMIVLSLDSSEAAQEKARLLAENRGVKIGTLCKDIFDWDWPVAGFDLVAALHFHLPTHQRKAVHQAYLKTLKPGGHLIMEVFHPEQLEFATGGPMDLDLLYTADSLKEDFNDAEILTLQEDIVVLPPRPKRPSERPAKVTRLLLRKP